MNEQYAVPDNENFDDTQNEKKYILRLFVTGASPNSIRAITNIKKICEKYLNGKYELEIIDIHQQPLIAAMITVLVVRHNQHCDGLAKVNPHWSDDTLYREARYFCE